MATDPRAHVAAFAAYLREHGFAVGYAEVELMVRAAAAVPLAQWTCIAALWRAIAAGTRKQWMAYPDLHRAYWFPQALRASTRTAGVVRRGRTLPELVAQLHAESDPGRAREGAPPSVAALAGAGETAEAMRGAQGGASRAEALERKDFAEWTPRDRERFELAVEAFRRRLRRRLLRRVRHDARGAAILLRRCLRGALSTAGELVVLHRAKRRPRPPRVVLLVDVSRSMETHAHFYVRLARAFVEVMDARAFVFHTRVAEATALMKRRSDRVEEKMRAVAFGFGGGTRIASSVQEVVDGHLRHGFARGDMLLVFSDGFDTDAPDALAGVLARVRGQGAHVYWLHPTRTPPASVAMTHARPHVTRLLPAHDLASLARLPELITAPPGRPKALAPVGGGERSSLRGETTAAPPARPKAPAPWGEASAARFGGDL